MKGATAAAVARVTFASLMGLTGQAGASGPIGAIGPTAANGPTGAYGPTGAKITILKTDDAAQVNSSDEIGFTVVVSNSSTGDAAGVEITDPLPSACSVRPSAP
jgi:uncharacterized repeat protein (TIGR01451 family)